MELFGTSTTSLYDTVVQAFMEAELKFRTSNDQTILQLGFTLENGTYQVFVKTREDRRQVLFFGYTDSKVPADKRLTVAELLTRANFGILVGNFELDMDTGEIRYKTCIDVDGGHLTPKMVHTHVTLNVGTLNQYLPSILSVIYGGVEPKAAIQKIEG
ncbi:MAG: YbjN domain-containing protein [Nitrospira sp.]|nr:YbjN domain-containing protein [Nitrospira sp.]